MESCNAKHLETAAAKARRVLLLAGAIIGLLLAANIMVVLYL